MAKFQDGVKRLCLVDDLKMLKITMSNTSSRNKLNPEINDHYNIFTRERQEYELKTEDKAQEEGQRRLKKKEGSPDEEKEVDYEILDRKYPIKEWKTECLGTKPQTNQAEDIEEINLNVVIRSNGQKRYFNEMPEGFDRVLWGDLMVLFNPDDKDEFWNSQLDWIIMLKLKVRILKKRITKAIGVELNLVKKNLRVRILKVRLMGLRRAKVIENQVMDAPVISISSDTSEESVGSHALRVILFGVIPAIIPEVPIVPADPIVTPDVGAVSVVSPIGVLDLVDYSPSSDSDPSEDSLPPVPALPLVSPFLCSDDTKADDESEPADQRPVSSSHDTLAPLSEFPLAPVIAPPGIRRRLATLIRPGEAIPFGRPYRTHPNGPRKLLTARKRVRPLPARRVAWRRVSHHSSDRHSSPDSSSSNAPSDYSLSRHTPPDTTDADLSTPQRFVHRSLARTPRHSEAFKRWRSAPFSTPYPPTTSESSLGSSSERSLDSSSPSSGPSRKRCRSPTASVPSTTHVSRSIAPTPADLLPPRKRFRDSYSLEDSGEEHMEVDIADADVGISEGVVAYPKDGVGIGFEIVASDVREDDEEFEAEASAADTREIVVDPLAIGDSSESSRAGIPDLEDTIYDIVHYMSEVRIDRITEIETTQRQLETSQMVASEERASLVERIRSLRLEYLKVRAMLSIERDRIDSIRWYMSLSHEEFRQVRRDRDDTRRRLRRLESYVERHLGFSP
ncbi:hypothetical protein Tco_1575242 [Tanacetum coccineum]